MEKFIVSIEFRYHYQHNGCQEYDSKKITLGFFDSFDDAANKGNKALELLESKFPLHIYPSGKVNKRERFSKDGGLFGSKNNLVTNLAYLKTPFDFFAKITTLEYDNVEKQINNILNLQK